MEMLFYCKVVALTKEIAYEHATHATQGDQNIGYSIQLQIFIWTIYEINP